MSRPTRVGREDGLQNNFPKLHNAMWPGIVGKGPGAEPFIAFETLLDLTAATEVDGQRFDGVDLFLAEPHTSIDSTDDDLKRLADQVASKGLVIGSLVAPVWPPVGGGSAAGSAEERDRFVEQVEKACSIGERLNRLGIRPSGVIRIDSAASVTDWEKDPAGNTKLIIDTFRRACDVAEAHGERLAAEGEICWGGMQSLRTMMEVLEGVGRPDRLGFQADMAHTLLYTLGVNAEADRLLPASFTWDQQDVFQAALKRMTDALRPWTIDFHVAQNDATVKGTGSHDKTGRHCLPNDPNGKLDPVRDSAPWLRGADGPLTKAFQHICWDGCMFSNDVMLLPQTWEEILGAMLKVRDAHGWRQ
jgi:sugar phosphate isomerase/epimerase